MDRQHWDEQFSDLEKYVAEKGKLPARNARRKAEDVDPRATRLVNFVRAQRRHRDRLTSEQIGLLEAVPGFRWDPNGDAWNANVHDYGEFYRKNGRRPSEASTNKREKRLAQWGSEQAGLVRGVPGRNRPTAERIAQLRAIPGWSVEPFSVRQNRRLEELKSFRAKYGRLPKTRRRSGKTNVMTASERTEDSLYNWISRQRVGVRHGTISGSVRAQIEDALGESLVP